MQLPSQTTNQDRSFMFELNVNAPVDLAQQALPGMKQKGGGWILNIGSATSTNPELPYRDSKTSAWIIGAYGATKAALDRYTEALAHEVQEHGIFVNCMMPTSIVLTSGADYVRDIARANPDWVEPVEMMAEGALELCSGRHVGRVLTSREIVHGTARQVHSLDGKTVLGDAFLLVWKFDEDIQREPESSRTLQSASKRCICALSFERPGRCVHNNLVRWIVRLKTRFMDMRFVDPPCE